MSIEWQVYIILCSDFSFYTGISTDVVRRFQQHKINKGAKYFRARDPKEIVYIESGHDRSSASQREQQIKKLSRQEKIDLIRSSDNDFDIASLISKEI